jgi:glycosyltransferase involved in cell wall biosynthesis
MKILVYALHYTIIAKNTGYIGGAWIRLSEFLKRADKFNLEYVLVEPYPKLGNNYESIKAANIRSHKRVGDTALMILYATIKGIRRALKGDVDLILNPIDAPFGTIPAFITSLMTGIPFTVVVHNTPVFHNLIEKYPRETFSSSLRGVYGAVRYFKHKGRPIQYAIISTLFNYVVFKILKTTTIIGLGSGVTYLRSVDKNLRVKEVFPANSIPSSVSTTPKKRVTKCYDAIYVGSFTVEKGVTEAIKAWKHVVNWNLSLRLALIGRVKAEEMVDTIKSLITECGLEDNVHFLCDPMIGASTEDVLKNVKKSKIMLLPSIIEAWSFTIGEALSFGLPVVAYDIQAFYKSYPDCKVLIRVPIGNTHQLYIEIRKLLENPSELKVASQEALRYMENYYTWDQVIAAEKNLYKSICC